MDRSFIIQYKIAGAYMYPLSTTVIAESVKDAANYFKNIYSRDSIIIAINGEPYHE